MFLDQTEVKYGFSNILDLPYSLVINCVNKVIGYYCLTLTKVILVD